MLRNAGTQYRPVRQTSPDINYNTSANDSRVVKGDKIPKYGTSKSGAARLIGHELNVITFLRLNR